MASILHSYGIVPQEELITMVNIVHRLVICLFLFHAGVYGAEDHNAALKGLPHNSLIRPPGASLRQNRAPCRVNPGALNALANGESSRLEPVIDYLTIPSCVRNAAALAKAAVAVGVSFNKRYPYHLDYFARTATSNNLKDRAQVGLALEKKVPGWLRTQPMSESMKPVLAQVALLSPGGAMKMVVNYAQQQLEAADGVVRSMGSGGESFSAFSDKLAGTLVELGMNRPSLAREFAASIEEMALLKQADSLSKIFHTLGIAANQDTSLVPTYNLSASALSNGIQKMAGIIKEKDKSKMMDTVFVAIQSAEAGNELFEPAMLELNAAMGPLMAGKGIMGSSLKKFYKETLALLARNASQPVLANAVGLSLTSEMIFLAPEDRDHLILAAINYPKIGLAVQSNFLLGAKRLQNGFEKGTLTESRYNQMKERFVLPWIGNILELDPKTITRNWLSDAIALGLIGEKEIEKSFPVLMLSHLKEAGEASSIPLTESGLTPTVQSMAKKLKVLWTLSHVHLPALLSWVEAYEARQKLQ